LANFKESPPRRRAAFCDNAASFHAARGPCCPVRRKKLESTAECKQKRSTLEAPMRRAFLLAAIFLSHASAHAGVTPELTGYLRAGTGTNGKGGKMECFRNQGAQGNELRLGNE